MSTIFGNPSSLNNGPLEIVVRLLILGLIIYKLMYQRATALQWAAVVLLLAVGVVVWMTSGEGWMFWAAIFTVSAKGIKLKKAALASLIGTVPILVSSVFLSTLGVIDNVVIGNQLAESARLSMGFIHPNTFGSLLVTVCVAYAVYVYGSYGISKPVIVCIFSMIILSLTAQSRTSMLCILVTAALIIMMKMTKSTRAQKAVVMLCAGIAAAAVLATLYFMFSYNQENSVHRLIDNILSGRPSLSHHYYLKHPLSVFGYNYSMDPVEVLPNGEQSNFLLDNAYARIALRYGLVSIILYISALFSFFWKSYQENYWGAALLGVSVFALLCFSETLGACVECNFSIVCFSASLFGMRVASFDGDVSEADKGEWSPVDALRLMRDKCKKI